MLREAQSFSSATEEKLLKATKLTLRVGGARGLRVPEAPAEQGGRRGSVSSGGPPQLKPYVAVSFLSRAGRRMEGAHLNFETGPPKAQLTLSEAAPVWNEQLDIDLASADAAQIDAVLLVIRDAGKRGLFGGKSQDPTLAQARVPWSQLSDANLETREFALALTDDGGAETGATLWVRANHANLSRYLAEVTSLEEALERAERQRAQLGAGNERAELRLQHETEIMEHEMDLDFQQQASVQAARVLRELRSQLLHFVQQEESLCAEEEAQLTEETEAAVARLEAASEESMKQITLEKNFYPEEAPLLHAVMMDRSERDWQDLIVRLQHAGLAFLKLYNDGKADALQAMESRLHQATDYQRVLHREATHRVRHSCAAWRDLKVHFLRDEAEEGAKRFTTAQQRIQAEGMAGASVLHAALIALQGKRPAARPPPPPP